MDEMTCTEVNEWAPEFALGTLSPEEREARREAFVKAVISRIEKKPVQTEPIGMFAKPLVAAEP